MSMMNFEAISRTPVAQTPFKHFVVENALDTNTVSNIIGDFPPIKRAGIFPLSALEMRGNFEKLIETIRGKELENLMSEKFDVDLAGKPLMITVRGQCQKKDGRIHTDTESKVVTCLLYLNDEWDKGGGRLRLLRGPDDLNDYIAEVPPNGGTLVAFKRSHNSYHGHEKYVGQRRYIMFNWITTQSAYDREVARHELSAKMKKILPFSFGGY